MWRSYPKCLVAWHMVPQFVWLANISIWERSLHMPKSFHFPCTGILGASKLIFVGTNFAGAVIPIGNLEIVSYVLVPYTGFPIHPNTIQIEWPLWPLFGSYLWYAVGHHQTLRYCRWLPNSLGHYDLCCESLTGKIRQRCCHLNFLRYHLWPECLKHQ